MLLDHQLVLWGQLLDRETLLDKGNCTAKAVVEGLFLIGTGVVVLQEFVLGLGRNKGTG